MLLRADQRAYGREGFDPQYLAVGLFPSAGARLVGNYWGFFWITGSEKCLSTEQFC